MYTWYEATHTATGDETIRNKTTILKTRSRKDWVTWEKILNYLSDWNGAIDKEIDGIFFIKGVLFSVSVERRHRNCINWADTDRGPSPEQV